MAERKQNERARLLDELKQIDPTTKLRLGTKGLTVEKLQNAINKAIIRANLEAARAADKKLDTKQTVRFIDDLVNPPQAPVFTRGYKGQKAERKFKREQARQGLQVIRAITGGPKERKRFYEAKASALINVSIGVQLGMDGKIDTKGKRGHDWESTRSPVVSIRKDQLEAIAALKDKKLERGTEGYDLMKYLLSKDSRMEKLLENVESSIRSMRGVEFRVVPAGAGNRRGIADIPLRAGNPEIYSKYWQPSKALGVETWCMDYHLRGVIGFSEHKEQIDKTPVSEDRAEACLLTAFIKTFKNTIEARKVADESKRREVRTPVTYRGLYKKIFGTEPPSGPLPVKLNEMEPIFEEYGIAVIAVGVDQQIAWRFYPEKRSQNLRPNIWYILVAHNHVWVLNEQIRKLGYRYSQQPEDPEEVPEEEPEQPLSNRMYVGEIRLPERFACANNLAEFLQALKANEDAKNLTVISNKPTRLLYYLIKKMQYIPGAIDGRMGRVRSFCITRGKTLVTVRRLDMEADDAAQLDPEVEEKQYSLYVTQKNKLRACYMRKRFMSEYSASLLDALKNLKRGPRIFRFPGAEAKTDIHKIDFVRAYTSNMMEITAWPQYAKFDDFRPYEGAPLADTSLYIISVDKPDPILFDQTPCLCTGRTLLYAQSEGIQFDVRAQCTPHMVTYENTRAVVKGLYESELTSKAKKDIMNITYGMLQKSNNCSEKLFVVRGQKELDSMRKTDDNVVKLGADLFIIARTRREKLENGFLPLGHMVLDAMRVKLHQLCKKVSGIAQLVAVNTDCLYVSCPPSKLAALRKVLPLTETKLFQDIGKVQLSPLEKDDFIPENELKTSIEVYVESRWCPEQRKPEDAIVLENEYDVEEAISESERDNRPLLMLAKFPRAGKTFILREACRRRQVRGLFVFPTNKLADGQSCEFVDVCTVDILFGTRPDTDKERGGIDVSKYGMVVFDEAYLIPVYRHQRIWSLMKAHPNVKFCGAGDVFQNEPVSQDLNVPYAEYYDMFLRKMFPRAIELQIGFKTSSPEDRKKLMELCTAIRNEPDNLVGALRRCKVRFDEKINPKVPQLCYYRKTTAARINKTVHAALHGKKDAYADFAKVVSRKYGIYQGVKAPANYTYQIIRTDNSTMAMVNVDGKKQKQKVPAASLWRVSNARQKIVVPLDKLREYFDLPYANTCHSEQGLSVGPELQVHDVGCRHMTARWLYTAVSRCTTFDGLSVVLSKDEEVKYNHHLAQSRINGHIAVDQEKGFDLDDDTYVNESWVWERLEKQNNVCNWCHADITDDWSIDRVENSLPHTRTNCVLACRHCQCASGSRT